MKIRYFLIASSILDSTDNGHPERAFFQKFETFGLGLGSAIKNLGLFSKSPGDFRIEAMDF